VQSITIFVALDCVTQAEMVVHPYDGLLLGRPELTIAMGRSRIQRWFWALSNWEFFLVERTFHQVMSVFGVPRDPPPLGLSFEFIVIGDLAYTTSSFNANVDTSKDYAIWFAKSSTGLLLEMTL